MMPKEEKEWDISEDFEPVSFNAKGQATEFHMRERNETHEALGRMTDEMAQERRAKEEALRQSYLRKALRMNCYAVSRSPRLTALSAAVRQVGYTNNPQWLPSRTRKL